MHDVVLLTVIDYPITSLLCILPSYALLATWSFFNLKDSSTCALALRRVFPHTYSVLPLLRYLQCVARLFLRDAPSDASGVDGFGGLAIGLGQVG